MDTIKSFNNFIKEGEDFKLKEGETEIIVINGGGYMDEIQLDNLAAKFSELAKTMGSKIEKITIKLNK
jgi:hypothetical protein